VVLKGGVGTQVWTHFCFRYVRSEEGLFLSRLKMEENSMEK
jgi:hypothetical protein